MALLVLNSVMKREDLESKQLTQLHVVVSLAGELKAHGR
jgi:hypothetical protein